MNVIINIIKQNAAGFFAGAVTTMEVALLGTIIGSCIGLLIGVVKTIPIKKTDGFVKRVVFKIINTVLTVYIEIFRGTPMIIQAVIIFYGAAQLFGIHMDFLFAGIFIVSINTGAYMSEIVRGGINSIDNGQFEAAHAIGMSHGQTMFNIILPQTIRNILPATSNEFVINIKDTAVLNVIGLSELFFKTKGIYGKNYLYYQTAIIACAIYFILTFATTRILRLLERKFRGSESYAVVSSQKKSQDDMNTENTKES
ncbi:MAG: amino acid ABC transporter permease [Oscillospiraceae bacterium]|nr:amino acid ABC transporter permease [Oscillospiraceae bacterium]